MKINVNYTLSLLPREVEYLALQQIEHDPDYLYFPSDVQCAALLQRLGVQRALVLLDQAPEPFRSELDEERGKERFVPALDCLPVRSL